MIRYSLSCDAGHGFESWFQSADAFGTLSSTGLVHCPLCGSTRIDKALMAPAVRPARNAATATPPADATPADRPLSTPGSEAEQAMAALRAKIEANSEYVGLNFAAEARAIHDGDAPERAIYGEAKPDEAKRLIDDGIPVAPLPFLPVRKTN